MNLLNRANGRKEVGQRHR